MKAIEIQKQEAKRDQLDSMLKIESTASLASSLDGLKRMLSDGQSEINALKQHNASLVMRLNQLEEDFDKARHNTTLNLNKQEDTITEIRENMADLMADYDELMNNKAVLEFEIHTYTRLLGLEETRATERVPKVEITNATTTTTTTTAAKKTRPPAPTRKMPPSEKEVKLNPNATAALTDLKESLESLKSLKEAPPPLPPQLPPTLPVKNIVNGLAKKAAPVNETPTPAVATANSSDCVDVKNPSVAEASVVGGKQLPSGEFRIITSETKCKTTFQRSAKGPISICECSPDGKVIIVENTSKNKDIPMVGFLLCDVGSNNTKKNRITRLEFFNIK